MSFNKIIVAFGHIIRYLLYIGGNLQDFQRNGLAHAQDPAAGISPVLTQADPSSGPGPVPALTKVNLRPCHKIRLDLDTDTCPDPGSGLGPVSALTQAKAPAPSLPRPPAQAPAQSLP